LERQDSAGFIFHADVVMFLARTCQAIDSRNKECDQVVEGFHLIEKSQETKAENMTADVMHFGQNWEAVFYCTIVFFVEIFQLQASPWPIWEYVIDADSKGTHVCSDVMFLVINVRSVVRRSFTRRTSFYIARG
jgi:hypothetical protein